MKLFYPQTLSHTHRLSSVAMSVSRARRWFQRRAAQELPTTVLEEHIEKLKGFVKEHKDKCLPRPMPEGKLEVHGANAVKLPMQ